MSGDTRLTMFHYQLWGYTVASDFDLGELEPSSPHGSQPNGLSICAASENDWPAPNRNAILESHQDGELWFASWKSDEGYIARYHGFCTFRVLPHRMRIEFAPEPGLASSTTAHMILDHAIPRLLSVKPGYLVLHACAMQIEGRSIAILGESGTGKSTLGAWFAAQGFPLLTDDCLVLRFDERSHQWLAQPSYRSVRLWPDSTDALGLEPATLREFAGASSKRRTSRDADLHFASEVSPLNACFVLAPPADSTAEPPAGPETHPLSVNEAFLAVAQAVFRLDVEDERINRSEFEVLTGLLDTVRFYSLAYERNYDSLPAVQQAIIQTILAPKEN